MNENKLDQKDQQILPSGGRPAQNNDYYEDEIDLFELIHMLLKNKKPIALITLAITTLTVLASLFIIKPQYQLDLDYKLDIPAVINTPYGGYTPIVKDYPSLELMTQDGKFYNYIIQNIEEYTPKNKKDYQETYEKLKQIIKLSPGKYESDMFTLSIKNGDTKFIEKLGGVLAEGQNQYLNHYLKEDYLKYFANDLDGKITMAQFDMDFYTELLQAAKELSQTTPMNITGTSEINPGWIKLQGEIMEYQKSIEEANAQIEIYSKKLENIKEEQTAIQEDKAVQEETRQLLIPYNIEEPTLEKVSPRLGLNTAIGLILGFMIAVFYVFTKEWWKNSEVDIKTRWNQYK